MNHHPPCVSRADLLRLMDEIGCIDARAAVTCGYDLSAVAVQSENPRGKSGTDNTIAGKDQQPDAGPEAPAKMAPWPFFRVIEFEAKAAVPERRIDDTLTPLTNQELRVRYHRSEIPFAPLVPWRRLVAFLRSALGRCVTTQRVHDRKLGRMLARGLPLTSLPRMNRRAWAPQAVILCDRSWREMAPFQEDLDYLPEILRKEMGKAALKIIEVNGPPTLRQIANLSAGVPVLALSTLGQYEGHPHIVAAWAAVAEVLTLRGHPVAALCPCPRWHWREKICATWPLTIWDGRPRTSRRVAWQHPVRRCEREMEATGELRDLLSPASLVERRLLRAARLKMGSPADVGCEWEVWFDPHGWASSDYCGLVRRSDTTSEEKQALRLKRRSSHPLARDVDELIFIQHGRYSPLVEIEARIRAISSDESDSEDVTKLVGFLKRAVERLRAMDPEAEDIEDQRSNLAPSFVEMVDLIPPYLRAHPDLAELISEGLGHAHRFMRTGNVHWQEGIRETTALQAYQARGVPTESFRKYELGLFPTPEGKQIGLFRLPNEEFKDATHFGVLSVSNRHPLMTTRKGRIKTTQPISFGASFTRLAELERGALEEVRIESELEILKCKPFTRPAWAKRMWYDRYGLAAEFQVKGISFVLRWIPPGRFLMGSPEDEPARYEDEGPQHERVIRDGFWLGEAPVTQAQWLSVMDENPSFFKGPVDLPVESVSWNAACYFCEMLKLFIPGLSFRLPQEQEWEYACRAGTETALWTGGITIRGENDAPELNAISWYGGNSGQELEVSNSYVAKDWPKQQYSDKEVGVHAVRGKAANPWGLYDMLGNVWEWCEDVWDAAAYDKFGRGEEPAKVAEDAGRVVRGGSWDSRAWACRAASRGRDEPGGRWNTLGFRLAARSSPEVYDGQAGQEQGAAGAA